jgi:Lrp/AsnC family transcriptional regulator for asnA, asnC and gidA
MQVYVYNLIFTSNNNKIYCLDIKKVKNIQMIDDIDKNIIRNLSLNAKMSMSEIASKCELSTAGVHQRIKKLEDSGIIKGSKIMLDTEKLGLSTMAFVGLFLEKAGLYHEVVKEVAKIKEVVECSFTTGNYSLLVKVYCRDNTHLMDVLSNKIQNLKGLARTETFICLEHPIDRSIDIDSI